MGIKKSLAETANRALARYGAEIAMSHAIYPWQRLRKRQSNAVWPSDPTLTRDRPEIRELERRYGILDPRVTNPAVWKSALVDGIDLHAFRSDNAYLWQERSRNHNPISTLATYYYLKSNDDLRLLEALHEDGAFGAQTMEVDGRRVSRDLLDSVSELQFLHRHLRIFDRERVKILDIGAGYGRLASHAATAMGPRVDYLCADAVPVSTFLCGYYLAYRNVQHIARAVPLDELDEQLPGTELAINVNSFPECRIDAIEWWLDRLAEHRVKHLFVEPNAIEEGGRRLVNFGGHRFEAHIEARGYRLKACEPKYSDPALQEYGIEPTYYFLFERS